MSVRIRTSAGWSKRSSKARYTFVAPPSLTKLAPTSGPFTGGQRVTLTGKNLKLTKKVVFGTLKATILSKSASTVVVRTPVGVLGGTKVKVTTPAGQAAASRLPMSRRPARPARRSRLLRRRFSPPRATWSPASSTPTPANPIRGL